MFEMVCYKNGRKYKTLKGKDNVFTLFCADMRGCQNRFVKHNKASVTVSFTDGKYTVTYRVPIDIYNNCK